VLGEAVQFSLDQVVLLCLNKNCVKCCEGLYLLTIYFSLCVFNPIRLCGFKVIDIGTSCLSNQFEPEANSSKVTKVLALFLLDLVAMYVVSISSLFSFCLCSLPASKDVAFNVSVGAPQSSSGFQISWCGVPGQMSMADMVKMGRPQVRSLSKPMATTDVSYAAQSQNSKQTASTATPTTFDQRFLALPDPVPQTVNSSRPPENHQTHENSWLPQEEIAPGTQSTGIEACGDPSLSAASLDSSLLVANATNSQEHSHAEGNISAEIISAVLSERHLEILEQNNQFNDGLQKSSMYQPEVHSYVDGEGYYLQYLNFLKRLYTCHSAH
jgi:hypothetical protein